MLKKIIQFPLVNMIAGIGVVVLAAFLGEAIRNAFLDKTGLSQVSKDMIVALVQIPLALLGYILLFRAIEKREITELSFGKGWKNSFTGFLTGFVLQSLILVLIWLAGDYAIVRINPFSYILPSFVAAVVAGFIAELIIRGVVFRLIEEKLGTVISLLVFTLLFALLHMDKIGATPFSVMAKAIQAGFLVSAVYVYSRSLWLPIFLHFSWDFIEPGIYGGINPGISVDKTLFTAKFAGPDWLTGGINGPEASIQSIVFCLIAGFCFVWLAKKKNNFLKPYWKNSPV